MSDQYSLPSELDFHMLSRMYPSQKTEYRKNPFNAQEFFSGSMIQVMLHKQDRSFANPATGCLKFTADVICSVPVGGTQSLVTDSAVALMGSAWSYFSRYVSKQSGGSDIDQIEWPGRLVNTITNITLNSEEKRGMVSMGFNENTGYINFGWIVDTACATGATVTITYNFNIPLLGAMNTSKLIPLFVSDLEFNFTVASPSDCVRVWAPNANSLRADRIRISNVELIYEVLTLEESGFQQLLQMYPNVLSLKSQSYAYASPQALTSPGTGTQDIIIPFSLNSLKQFIWWASPSDSNAPGFDGVNPNLQNYNLIIGSTSYPQQPIKCDVGEIYYQNSKSFSSFYSSSHTGSCLRTSIAKASTAGGEFLAYNDNTTSWANRQSNSVANKFYCILDLETINQLKNNLYSGISTRGSTNTLRLNISRALKAGVTNNIHMYACYDMVLNFDYVNGRITYSN